MELQDLDPWTRREGAGEGTTLLPSGFSLGFPAYVIEAKATLSLSPKPASLPQPLLTAKAQFLPRSKLAISP